MTFINLVYYEINANKLSSQKSKYDLKDVSKFTIEKLNNNNTNNNYYYMYLSWWGQIMEETNV